MKTLLGSRIWTVLALAAITLNARGQGLGEGVAVVPAEKIKQQPPLFYSVDASTTASHNGSRALTSMQLTVNVHQGRAEKLSIGLAGDGEVTEVKPQKGQILKSWAVRRESDGRRFLDLFPELPAAQPQSPSFNTVNPWWDGIAPFRPIAPPAPVVDGPKTFRFSVTATHDLDDETVFAQLLPAAGDAVGFTSKLLIQEEQGFRSKVLEIGGMVREEGEGLRFQGSGPAKMRIEVVPDTGKTAGIELIDPRLTGQLAEDGKSMSFTLTGRVRTREADASLVLLRGVALTGEVSGPNWHVRLAREGKTWVHELVASGEAFGVAPLELTFEVAADRSDDWRMLAFDLPAGVVVPVRLEGLGEELTFDPGRQLVPEKKGKSWLGFLNAQGNARMAWKESGMEDDGALFFSSSEVAEVRVGAGLIRQSSQVGFRILQGKLETVRIGIEGPGEVLSVDGDPVLGWSLREADGKRFLDVELSRPIEGTEQLSVVSQSALGAFPVKAAPMRFLPEGTLRHSGYLRIANEGAVRLEVVGEKGMMQLAPAQFPGGEAKGFRQVFVYRFPSGDYEYSVAADQVLPEVSVSEVTIHEMGETDRRILSDLELDIREAPVREWSVGIPAAFAVAEVTGAAVADYSLASEEKDGMRMLKFLFSEAVSGRQLIQMKLERNEGAAAGEWTLPRLRHDGAKSSRGYIGVASAAGYRVVPGEVTGLVETPVDYFPKKMARLQQGFRIRDEAWTCTMKVEALAQSVQADVFHLYSLKEGVAYGSVVLNYFVVGAPSNEWRLRVPEGIGNIEVTGQGVGRDWRREGEELIVPLARPALGASILLVTFEQPMSARGGTLKPGEIRPLGVQSERGYVQVTSPLQVNSSVTKSEGSVLRIDATELPAEYRLLTSAPTLGAWQYTAGDVDLQMDIQWYEVGEAIGEVIDFASLDSHVSRDGQVVTTARLFARSKGAATLEFNLPEGANLWEALVDGERVNARKDGAKTLVPLSRQVDPNEAVEVVLRYGQSFEEERIQLDAPKVGTATAIANWTVRGDENRRLIPHDAEGAQLVRPVTTETGFEWIASHGRRWAPLLLMFAVIGLVLARIPPIQILGLAIMIGAAVMAFVLADKALDLRRVSLGALEYTAPAILGNADLHVVVDNVEPWKALVSGAGVFVALVGCGLLVWAILRTVGRQSMVRPLIAGGVALIAFGVLAQHGGAVPFFILFGIALLALGVFPKAIAFFKGLKKTPAAAATMIALAFLGLGERVFSMEPAESIVQGWELTDESLKGEIDVRVRASEIGERFHLLSAPAVLTGFKSDGLKVEKQDGGYVMIAQREGVIEGTGSYQLKVGSPRNGFAVPTGPAAVQTIYARYEKPGWQFEADGAARIREQVVWAGMAGKVTEIQLAAGQPGKVLVRPKKRDASQEEVKFFTEVADLYLPGPGVVNGIHRVAVRPAQGVVDELLLTVPDGFTVGDVYGGPVGRWRFNPETRELRVAIEPAQERPFTFEAATQQAAGSLPVDLKLSPMRVGGSSGSVGMLGLGFGGEAQPEAVEPAGMGEINLDDFPSVLIPMDSKKRPLALLQHAFRYGSDEASVSLKVAPVAPEIRAEMKQTLSLGDDRMVLAADLLATISRAGVFRLTVELPAGMEVESVTGGALSHWTESEVDGVRLLTLNLNGRTMGQQNFSLSLAGPSPGSIEAWPVPRLLLRDAARQRGTLSVVPERGLQVRAVNRSNVSQLDPREMGVPRPGALAFRLLQADWSLELAVQELDPWVTAQVLQQVTLREGQVRTQARLLYRIENAARKSLRVKLPGLDERAAGTVRATGPAVGDFVPIDGEEGVWEIRFQRGVAGETPVDIEFQQQRQSDSKEFAVVPLELTDVRQSSYFIAVEAGGRLNASLGSIPRGWQKLDWNAVPTVLRELRGPEVPDFTFRVAEAEAPLQVALARHGLADAEALRVTAGRLSTLISMDGSSMTAVKLQIEVAEKASLRLRLPGGAKPFNLLVNGEGVPLVRNGDEWLFYVSPSPLGDGPAEVAFTYSLDAGGVGELVAPQLDVPLENLTWDVFVPEGWLLADSSGDFQWTGSDDVGEMSLADYRGYVQQRRDRGKAEAVAELDQGYAWLQAGQQDKAGKVLGKAARNGYLDEASNEDARVQFRNLKMQQAVLGLNTRRQRNYLDNRFNQVDVPNQQIEQAAEENPILQGDYNFDPTQFDRLMAGNSAEETSSLREIANAIVEQQLEMEGAPDALSVDLLGQGRLLRFERSLQVKGDQPMTLQLKLQPERPKGWFYGGLIGLLAAVILVIGCRREKTPEPADKD
ncbi:RNA-binding protein [Haloferula helveola]|uniref:RNA-binding protein n=1 Tax=Haloferula helveola TaxID=490095 RepID=A0ABN6HEW0_9BACT|nr:RNA-binding protein [Haloferula helveola]